MSKEMNGVNPFCDKSCILQIMSIENQIQNENAQIKQNNHLRRSVNSNDFQQYNDIIFYGLKLFILCLT